MSEIARGDRVKSLLTGREHLRNGLVLEPWEKAPLDRVWVHWPGDGEQVWAEKISDLELEHPTLLKRIQQLEEELRLFQEERGLEMVWLIDNVEVPYGVYRLSRKG